MKNKQELSDFSVFKLTKEDFGGIDLEHVHLGGGIIWRGHQNRNRRTYSERRRTDCETKAVRFLIYTLLF